MQKILFNSKYGLMQAVFDGRKTMTRRAISAKVLEEYRRYEKWYQSDGYLFGELKDSHEYLIGLSTYKVGEVVAIAQAYKDVCMTDPIFFEGMRKEAGWNNKMFVCAEYMPHHIYITDIKVERLQDISDEDCLKEGVKEGEFMNTWDRYYFDTWGDVPNHIAFPTPREAFAALIDKVGGKGTWASNPLVFAYSFKRIN